ncbi:nitrile hydratase subunit beta [Candidatus Entotheonella serta]|nr:nitrile hydratase subunit beta [Candidatus Entotheonella serta]
MNGIHDMGGMQGLGKLGYQENEPGFHEPWEIRVFALIQAMQLVGGLRQYIERIPGMDYLRMSYYERWHTAFVTRLIESGVVTQAEIENGRADPASVKATPKLIPAAARELLFRTPQTEQNISLTPRFHVGDRVRGRNIHPSTHTRMPRYTRGKIGVVERDRGVFMLPDREHVAVDPRPQHVYLVHFTARELWGEDASGRDSLYIDMWEDYLEPA